MRNELHIGLGPENTEKKMKFDWEGGLSLPRKERPWGPFIHRHHRRRHLSLQPSAATFVRRLYPLPPCTVARHPAAILLPSITVRLCRFLPLPPSATTSPPSATATIPSSACQPYRSARYPPPSLPSSVACHRHRRPPPPVQRTISRSVSRVITVPTISDRLVRASPQRRLEPYQTARFAPDRLAGRSHSEPTRSNSVRTTWSELVDFSAGQIKPIGSSRSRSDLACHTWLVDSPLVHLSTVNTNSNPNLMVYI